MSTTEATHTATADTDVTSKEAWAKRGVHRVTLPSGAVVHIRIPDLGLLLAADAVPEALRDIAMRAVVEAIQGLGE